MKVVLGLICLFSVPAFSCSLQDARAWFQQMTPAAVSDYCRGQGNLVASINVQKGEGSLASDPSTVIRQYAIKCTNGSVLLGILTMDSSTCAAKSASTDVSTEL